MFPQAPEFLTWLPWLVFGGPLLGLALAYLLVPLACRVLPAPAITILLSLTIAIALLLEVRP